MYFVCKESQKDADFIRVLARPKKATEFQKGSLHSIHILYSFYSIKKFLLSKINDKIFTFWRGSGRAF